MRVSGGTGSWWVRPPSALAVGGQNRRCALPVKCEPPHRRGLLSLDVNRPFSVNAHQHAFGQPGTQEGQR